MCGIVGWVDFTRDLTREMPTLERMTETMRLRGPDSGGVWCRPRVGLGHRRLAIIDVVGGAQPFVDTVGPHREPVVLVYSGEVYNFRELRSLLKLAATGSEPAPTLRSCSRPTRSGGPTASSTSTGCSPSRSGIR